MSTILSLCCRAGRKHWGVVAYREAMKTVIAAHCKQFRQKNYWRQRAGMADRKLVGGDLRVVVAMSAEGFSLVTMEDRVDGRVDFYIVARLYRSLHLVAARRPLRRWSIYLSLLYPATVSRIAGLVFTAGSVPRER